MIKTLLRFIFELINLPGLVRNISRNRNLITSLTWREFNARYRGSFGGLFWSFIQPLTMMVIYTLVFSSFLKIKFGTSDSPFAFSVYLLCGLLPWTAFSEAISISTTLISSNSNLVKRVVFPLEILPLNTVLANTLHLCIGLLLLIPMTWLLNGHLSWSIAAVPIILLFQTMLFTGIAWYWTSLSVYLPDIRQFTPMLLTVVMFLTPIFYPIDLVPEWAIPIMSINPFADLVLMYRLMLMQGKFPGLDQILKLLFIALFFFMTGYFWFKRTQKGFADVL